MSESATLSALSILANLKSWGDMYLGKKVSVIIPAKNEAANVSRLIPEIPKFVDETIIVVSSETDSTLESIRKFDKSRKIISLIQDNVGKGDAQKKGLSQITGDYVCMIDADGSVNLDEIQQMLHLLINNNLDLVKGSRYLGEGGSDDLTKFRSLGNLILTKLTNILFAENWSDLAYGLVGYRRDAIKKLHLLELQTNKKFLRYKYGNGFELETVILTRGSRLGFKIEEFPSFELQRVEGFSNLRAIRDGFRLLFAILYERFRVRNFNH